MATFKNLFHTAIAVLTIIAMLLICFTGCLSCATERTEEVIGIYAKHTYYPSSFLGSSTKTEIFFVNQGSYMCFGDYNFPFPEGTKIGLITTTEIWGTCKIRVVEEG